MKKLLIFLSSIFFFLSSSTSVSAQPIFRFVAWGDTKSDTTVLKNLSNQAKGLYPKFTIYAGDLESSGFTQSGMDTWKNALDGGTNNGMFNKTFPVRGNHDSSNPAGWQAYYNLSATAQGIGATNYSFLDDDLTYSFDVFNSRIIGIDVPGNVTLMTSAQISWLDERLTDAENRGLKHAFLYWHGPFYSQANHCCPIPPSALISVINKHPIVSAMFFGHEHILTYTHINSSRVPGVTKEFEQVISGDAGAGITVPTAGRYDYALDLNGANVGGFVTIDVYGDRFILNYYKGGTAVSQYTKTITKGSPPPISISPTRTPTPTLCAMPTPPYCVGGTLQPSNDSQTPGVCPPKIICVPFTPTPSGGKPGDANNDNKVDGLDYIIWLNNYNKQATGAGFGDFNGNGFVDGLDYIIWLNNYNK